MVAYRRFLESKYIVQDYLFRIYSVSWQKNNYKRKDRAMLEVQGEFVASVYIF